MDRRKGSRCADPDTWDLRSTSDLPAAYSLKPLDRVLQPLSRVRLKNIRRQASLAASFACKRLFVLDRDADRLASGDRIHRASPIGTGHVALGGLHTVDHDDHRIRSKLG